MAKSFLRHIWKLEIRSVPQRIHKTLCKEQAACILEEVAARGLQHYTYRFLEICSGPSAPLTKQAVILRREVFNQETAKRLAGRRP